MDAMCITIQEFDDGKNVVVRLVERVEDFVLGDSNGGGIAYTPFDFDKAQASIAGPYPKRP